MRDVSPDKERIKKVLGILADTYKDAKIILNYSNPFELLVAVILSAQCTDIMVNKVTEKLFKKYKTLDDYVVADLGGFEKDIKSTGFYKNKAKNILATAKIIKDNFLGKVPDTMEDLITLSGVARKTANIILGNLYQKIEGIAVDTHVLRISQRLRLVDLAKTGGKKELKFLKSGKEVLDYKKDANAVKVEAELMKVLPRSRWFKFTYQIIKHGRSVCKAVNPKCGICPLQNLCQVKRI